MTTEQQQIEALKTLHEAIQALKSLGLMSEDTEENYLASDCTKCKREFNYLEHKSDICVYCEEDEDEN